MTIAVTGHRPDKLGNDWSMKGRIANCIKSRLQNEIDFWRPDKLVTGMALGVDTLFARLAIENNIPFIAAIPCRGQDSKWYASSRQEYMELINNKLCDCVYVSNEPYNSYAMQRRNEWMVNNSDMLLAVWDGSAGGTANCVNYARYKNKTIIIINPKEYATT